MIESAHFIAQLLLRTNDLKESLRQILVRLGEATSASRAYIYKNKLGPGERGESNQRYEWAAPGFEVKTDNPRFRDGPYRICSERIKKTLESGVFFQANTSGLPAKSRAILEALNIYSIALAPIFVEGNWWGYLGLDHCGQEREWTGPEQELLKGVANSIATAIFRRRAERALRQAHNQLEGIVSERSQELIHLNRSLKREVQSRQETEIALRRSEERYQLALDAAEEGLWDWNLEEGMVYGNTRYFEMMGHHPSGNHSSYEEFLASIHPHDRSRTDTYVRNHIKGADDRYEIEYRVKNHSAAWLWILDRGKAVERNGKGEPIRVIGTCIDITDRKASEQALRERERDLRSNALKLEEMNSALKVLLKLGDEERQELEKNILYNVKELVIPALDKLKATPLSDLQKDYLSIVYENLNHVISPFLRNLAFQSSKLTPREIQVASLIRENKTSKEIAGYLSLSVRSVEVYRGRIRGKLGLKNKRSNLRSYLLSLT